MNLSTLLQPPQAPPEPPELGRSRRPAGERARARSRRYRRTVAIGLIVSVAVHLLVIVVSPLVVRYLETVPLLPAHPLIVPRPEGMRAIEFRVTETPPVPEEPPREEPEPEVRQPQPEPVTRGESGEETTLSAAERLRPRVGDWRLWVLPPIRRSEPTPAEREARLRNGLYASIEALNDSMAAAEARAAESMDWTVGEEGNKWGISPGKIHLGPITLPLPLNLGAHPAVQRQQGLERAEWEAIQRQAGQGVVAEDFDDRVKAIRERKAKERAQEKAKEDSTSSR